MDYTIIQMLALRRVRYGLLCLCWLLFSQAAVGQRGLPDNLVRIHEKQIAKLLVEGIGFNGGYIIKGYASIKNGRELSVSLSGWVSFNKKREFCCADFFAKVRLIINDVQLEEKPAHDDGSPVALPNDGTVYTGEAKFDLPVDVFDIERVDVEIQSGYVHSQTNATPFPQTKTFRINVYQKELAGPPSLFLFDVSGSMQANNKMGQARQAAQRALSNLQQQATQAGQRPKVGVMTFSGSCGAQPRVVQPFTDQLAAVSQRINSIVAPSGGTPLPEAVRSARTVLEAELAQSGLSCGELIVLGDGQSSCGAVRPPGAYAGVYQQKQICGANTSGAPAVTFYTIGFGIAPGSVAERDLQYLAAISGGRYFNAKNEQQLTRAFTRIKRIYIPIANPQNQDISSEERRAFYLANRKIRSEQYDSALVLLKQYINTQASDSSGLYNLALMFEANERYQSAIRYYELYLKAAPTASNSALVEQRIATLHQDYKTYIAYMQSLLESDLAYLNQHYQQLLRTPNAVPLAGEFEGFIREKGPFYASLSKQLEMKAAWLKSYSKDISRAFEQATYFLNNKPKNWDMDGIAMIGNIHYPLEQLIKKLKP